MDAYGIKRDEIDKVIKVGMKWRENNSNKWHAKMAGIECVFIKEENDLFVITVYLNGGEK